VSSSGDSPGRTGIAIRAHTLLKEAQIERMQGNYRAAVAKCEEAIELAPRSADGHEALGDVHCGAAHFKAAMSAYRQALKLDPSRGAVEEKLGRASIGQFTFQRQTEYGRGLLDGKGSKKDIRKAANNATAVSILCPGLGQVLNGHYVKAAIGVCAHLLFVFLLISIVGGAIGEALDAETAVVNLDGRPVGVVKGVGNAMNVLKAQGRAWQVYALIILDLGLWGWSIVDAGIAATKREEEAYV